MGDLAPHRQRVGGHAIAAEVPAGFLEVGERARADAAPPPEPEGEVVAFPALAKLENWLGLSALPDYEFLYRLTPSHPGATGGRQTEGQNGHSSQSRPQKVRFCGPNLVRTGDFAIFSSPAYCLLRKKVYSRVEVRTTGGIQNV